MKKLRQEQEFRKSQKISRLWLGVLAVLVLLIGIRVFIANSFVEQARIQGELEADIKKIEFENQMLNYRLDETVSMTGLTEVGRRMGFISPTMAKYITNHNLTADKGYGF